MKNKITAIILTLALLPVIFLSQTASATKAGTDDILAFMDKMGFISASEISGDKLEKPITRVDFAIFAARVLGVQDSQPGAENYFYDIPDDHWGKTYINSLVEMGIVSDKDRYFRPDDVITKSEAAKIAVTCIGANGEADMYGGYPNGYLSVASKEKLFSGIESSKEMTYKGAAILLYNMMNAEIVQMDIIGGDVQFSRTGDTLLSVYHHIYKREGTVNAVYGASVDENRAKTDKEVIIGGITYDCTDWLYDYLGMNVTYFYQDNDGDESVVYIFDETDNKNETTYIFSDDYIGFNGGNVEYYENDKTKRVKISDGAVVIRNGENVSADLTAAFADFYGNMRIIDTGKLSGADVVIIEDYTAVAVGYINSEDNIVYDKYNAELTIDLSEENGESVKYFDKDGNVSSFSAISKNGVINVAAASDRSFALVYINSETIAGKISGKGTDSDGDKYIEVDGNRYKTFDSFYEKYEGAFGIGESGTFKTDMFGRIAYYSMDKNDEFLFAYLINAYIDIEFEDEMLDGERVILKMFTEDGEIVRTPCAEKVKVDGETIKDNEQIMESLSARGVVTSQLIRIKYDKDGDIKIIDTNNYNKALEGKYSLRLLENNYESDRHWTGIVGRNAYVTSDVKVIVIPENPKTADSANFMIKNIGYIPSEGSGPVDIYQLDPESLKVDIAVYQEKQSTGVTTYSPLYVVEDITEALDGNDRPALCFTLNGTGSRVEYLVSENYKVEVTDNSGKSGFDPSLVGIGDIIRVRIDYKNEISNMERVFDYSKAQEDGDYNFFTNSVGTKFKTDERGNLAAGFRNGLKTSYGYVTRVDGNTFQWAYSIEREIQNKDKSAKEVYNTGISSVKIIVFDSEAKRERCRTGTVADLVGYYQSAANFSKIITMAKDVQMSQMIIYK